MKTLYIDCGMGCAGDMLTGALIDLFENKQEIVDELNSLHIPGVEYVLEDSEKCGIHGVHMKVLVHGHEEGEHHHVHEHDHHHDHHHHSHNNMHGIHHIVYDHMTMDEDLKKKVLEVYNYIAEAEAHAHSQPIEEIHFHEVGTMDAVADVSAVVYLMNRLGVDKVIASPVSVGYGSVHCAHGILPVPAPATAYILKDIPVTSGDIEGELCTPTGAALLKYFCDQYEQMPLMKIQSVGYGMGYKDFKRANCVRTILGTTEDKKDEIIALECNIDDMTPEALGYAQNILLKEGARDVFIVPIVMKKQRQAQLLKVITDDSHKDTMIHLIFQHTSTIGIRETSYHRYVLNRKEAVIETYYGPVRQKISSGYGVEKIKYEYDDIMKIAEKENISLEDVLKKLY